MSDQGIDALLKLAPPPARPTWHQPPLADDWKMVEADFGLELPTDYKRLIEAYGTGTFGESLQIMNPFSRNRYNNQRLVFEHDHLWQTTEPVAPSDDPVSLRAWNWFREGVMEYRAACPYELHPTRPGIFPWADVADDQAALYWLTDGDPDRWPIVVNYGNDGPRFEERSEHGCCELIVQWLLGNVQPPGFPKATQNKGGQWFTSWRIYDASDEVLKS